MSAKEHYHPVPVVLPNLPPEIWLAIFRLATWSQDMFNPQLMVSTGCDTAYREQLREFKRALVSFHLQVVVYILPQFYKVTKRYLVRVCKSWYSLASPFLFEYIFLGRGRVLASLRDGMLRSEQAVELQELSHTIGWWTQRLDVHIRDRTDNSGSIMDILADILERLPNLRVLTFAVVGHGHCAFYESNYLPENVIQATNACRDTLRLLNWYGGLRPSPNTWASFLENHPRLEAINAPVVLTQLGNSNIVLDSLRSIYVHCQTDLTHVENKLWNIQFPNLHHAIYDITSTPFEFPHHDFLSKIGPKLTSIQINCLKLFSTEHLMDFGFYTILSRMVVTCPNLTRLDLVTYEWKMSPFFYFYFPKTVHTLGIRVNVHQVPRRSLEIFFGSIYSFLSHFPSVKTVCFTDQRNVRVLRAHSRALRSNLAQIRGHGVNVMDDEGRLLVA